MSAAAPRPHLGVQIRPLSFADLPRIMEIESRSFSTPWRDSTFRGLLRRSDTDLLGAMRDERLVGYVISWTVLDQAEIGNVAVAPEARGCGIGRLLLRAILERLRHRRAQECFLEVRESNSVAQELYRSSGFEVVGRRRAYYADPVEDALVMRLKLSGTTGA